MVWNLIVVMVAQLCEHAKTTKFFTVIEGYLVWYVKLLGEEGMKHSLGSLEEYLTFSNIIEEIDGLLLVFQIEL